LNPLVLTVTKKHIEAGFRRNCSFCPVALALKERFTGQRVYVCCYMAEIGDTVVPLPEKVSDFIHAFDRGDPVTPFKVELCKSQ
jgi:hypothetical protein